MKKNLTIVTGLAALLLLAGCQTIEQTFNRNGLTAVMEPTSATKTSLSEGQGSSQVLWSDGDAISVFIDGEDTPSTFSLTRGAGSTVGSFSGDGQGSSYLAFYPQSMLVSRDGDVIDIELPAQQDYVPSTFDDDTYPMVAASSSSELQFRNLCSVLKISLVGSQTLSKIVFEANDPSVKVSGAASVDVSKAGAPELLMDKDASSELVLNASGVQLTNTAATDFYLVLPPQTYTGGFKVSVYAADGSVIEKSYDSDFTMERSKMHKAAVFAFDEPINVSKWLTFTSEGTTTISLSNTNNSPLLYYSYDGDNWNHWDYSDLTFTGQPLYLCGDNPDGFSFPQNTYSKFVAEGDPFAVSGDIMSLIDKEEDVSDIPSDYCFLLLFQGCSLLTEAPDLPATTLTYGCYREMFADCSSLISAPELPASSLEQSCYSSMFSGCTSLTSAPDLPATSTAFMCYDSMFKGCTALQTAPAQLPAMTADIQCYAFMFQDCTSLETAPALPATALSQNCYYGMFRGCTSLTEAPELPATTLAQACYYGMFADCASLTKAPKLPAEEMTTGCYSQMFQGCTGLTEAPALPGTSLADYCYNHMFAGCSGLTSAPELPATTLAPYCYSFMFTSCDNLTTAPELPATELADYCYQWMFGGCSSLAYAPELPATSLAPYCYMDMFTACAALTAAPELPAMNLAEGCYSRMFGGTGLTQAPELPATVLVDKCYSNMFGRCSGLTETPVLHAETLAPECYSGMFAWCTNLNKVTCLATDISAEKCVYTMLQATASAGTFVKSPSVSEEDWLNAKTSMYGNWTFEDAE